MGNAQHAAILGISALYHDSAACLLVDGEVVAAAQEERFTRKKHDDAFPVHAIAWCLSEAGLTPADLTHVIFYDKPLVKAERLVETWLRFAPRGLKAFTAGVAALATGKLSVARTIDRALEDRYAGPILYARHHESHAASAFFPSPFERAAVLTVDGVGEWATTSIGRGEGNRLRLLREMRFPHSLGLLYSAFTYYCGFMVNSGEYKLMGLAPYGRPVYRDRILERLVRLNDDGSFNLALDHFAFGHGLRMTNSRFHALFDGPPRDPEAPIDTRCMDVAASIQAVTEEILMRLARTAHQLTGEEHLCLAGGVALNCVANGRILREGPFRGLWIQPAAGDAGGALGAAWLAWHHLLGQPRQVNPGDAQAGSLLGPAFDASAIRRALDAAGAVYQVARDESDLLEQTVRLLSDQKVVGWFQGRLEFGPRALGSRSILADPRTPEMQSRVNLKIKFREGFRPFAPVVLAERCSQWFDLPVESPYMLLVAQVAQARRLPAPPDTQERTWQERLHLPRSTVAAVTHVDGSARIQTCDAVRNPRLHALLTRWEAASGCPVLLNTSFNVRGEPIVCTPEDAYRCFMSTDMDVLVLGEHLLLKEAQPAYRGPRVSAGRD
jgi:carbamoyltransferase